MTIFRKYNKKIQAGPAQISSIAGAILSCGEKCNFLVFGLGNDSGMWADINRKGYTLFLEDDPQWLEVVKEKNPNLNTQLVDYSQTNLAASQANPIDVIRSAQVPPTLSERKWDVILIDGPRGYKPSHPGRALPICWTAMIRTEATHIFVDDYQRKLESSFSDFLLLPKARLSTTIPRMRRGLTRGSMLWIIGNHPLKN